MGFDPLPVVKADPAPAAGACGRAPPAAPSAGSTRTDDGQKPIGGLLILDVESRSEAEAIFNADPFTQAGLRTNVVMRYWYKSILGGQIFA